MKNPGMTATGVAMEAMARSCALSGGIPDWGLLPSATRSSSACVQVARRSSLFVVTRFPFVVDSCRFLKVFHVWCPQVKNADA